MKLNLNMNYFVVIGMLGVLLTNCHQTVSPEEEAVTLVSHYIECKLPSVDTRRIICASFRDGYAVAIYWGSTSPEDVGVNCLMYWVLGKSVYAVNDQAKDCSPSLPKAPKEIVTENVMTIIADAVQRVMKPTSNSHEYE